MERLDFTKLDRPTLVGKYLYLFINNPMSVFVCLDNKLSRFLSLKYLLRQTIPCNIASFMLETT